MADVRVRFLKDGPIEVSGPIQLVPADGQVLTTTRDPVYLCRCGQSAQKPFCDGTHKKVGFSAEGWTRPSSASR